MDKYTAVTATNLILSSVPVDKRKDVFDAYFSGDAEKAIQTVLGNDPTKLKAFQLICDKMDYAVESKNGNLYIETQNQAVNLLANSENFDKMEPWIISSEEVLGYKANNFDAAKKMVEQKKSEFSMQKSQEVNRVGML